MLKIKEYLLSDAISLPQTLYLPSQAQVVSALEDSGVVTIFVLAENTCHVSELRTFEIHSAGDLFNAKQAKHIATYKSSLGVRHLFEIVKKEVI